MTCPSCGEDNPKEALFCIACATTLGRVCGACGTESPSEARFCMACASPLTAGGGWATRTRRQPWPRDRQAWISTPPFHICMHPWAAASEGRRRCWGTLRVPALTLPDGAARIGQNTLPTGDRPDSPPASRAAAGAPPGRARRGHGAPGLRHRRVPRHEDAALPGAGPQSPRHPEGVI